MSGRECFMVVPEQRTNRVREASSTGCRSGGAPSNHSVSYNHELHESPRMNVIASPLFWHPKQNQTCFSGLIVNDGDFA